MKRLLQYQRLARAAFVLAAAFFIGCSNSSNPFSKSTTVDDLGSLLSQNETGRIKIVQIVKSNQAPDSQLELIGDDTNAIGQLCKGTLGTGDDSADSNCSCIYEFQRDAAVEVKEIAPTHIEDNFIRCPYRQGSFSLPEVGQIKARIRILSTEELSQAISFELGGFADSLDTRLETSFVKVQRFQCRDYVFIPNMYCGETDASLASKKCTYDPIQSEDSRISFPMNYYASNLGGSLLALARESNSNPDFSKWDCSLPGTDVSAAWRSLNVYSLNAFDPAKPTTPVNLASTGATKRIAFESSNTLSGGRFDRGEFFLAKQATGRWSVPVEALIAPNIHTKLTEDPPLGFAVKPNPTVGGEVCPTDVPIPSGYKWGKLWAFRTNIEKRSYVVGGTEMAPMACNPGTYPGSGGTATSAGVPVYPDCGNSISSGGFTLTNKIGGAAIGRGPNSIAMSSRVLYGTDNVCVDVTPGGACGALASCGLPSGTDRFKRVGLVSIPISMWSLGDTFTAGASNDPKSFNVRTLDDLDGGASRFDFLFVVTSDKVMSLNMKPEDPIGQMYTPYRYYRKEDCPDDGSDKFNPETSTEPKCINRRVLYSPWEKEILMEDGKPFFPVCVLQKELL